jgi:hypothetical protein
MTGFEDRDLEALRTQSHKEPLGKLSSLKPDVLDLSAPMPDEPSNTVRVACSLAFFDDNPAFVDDADAGHIKRHVDSHEKTACC